jgi:hypothetical protein
MTTPAVRDAVRSGSALAVALALCACEPVESLPDAARPTRDSAVTDSASPAVVDAGSATTDASSATTDARVTVMDASASVDSGSGTDPFESARQACVDRINMYRATIGLPPYARWREAERCADQMAENDAVRRMAHDGFNRSVCSPRGNGQNECPNGIGTPESLPGCLAQMWAEGPTADGTWDVPHGHYMNMVGQYTYMGFMVRFSRVACGFSSMGWAVQNFE